MTLREVWLDEARHFTPWLARDENIALLGETIGLELEVEAQERSVGPFRADILCKDTSEDHWVLIENQLERTNHVHLGQLITYAAGLNAVTIVWIADRFAEEHRAALDWLNEVTGDDFRFFGLEVELWRIGDSRIAPKFNIVSKPNDWTASVSRASRGLGDGELTITQKLQLEYWTQFWSFLERRGSGIRGTKPRPQHWNNFSIGRSAFTLVAVINTRGKVIRAEIVCSGPFAVPHFQLLRRQRESIEREIGSPLEWQELPERKMTRIAIMKSDADPTDRNAWPEQHAWLADQLEALHRVFAPRIRDLDANEFVEEPDAGDEV